MKMQKIAIALTVTNALLLLLIIAYLQPAKAQPQQTMAPILRGRGLEIVDSLGKVRASVTVYPSTQEKGKIIAGATVFRLIDSKGKPVVKIVASENGGGSSFSNEADDYIQIISQKDSSFIKINQQGKQQVIKP